MFCPHCGAKQAESARFCERCGRPLGDDGPSPPAAEHAPAPDGGVDRRWVGAGVAVLVVAAVVAVLVLSGVFDSRRHAKPVARPEAATPSIAATTVAPTPAATETATSTPAPQSVRATVRRTCGWNGAGGDCHLSVRAQPSSAAAELRRLNEGDTLLLSCQVRGERVRSSVLGASSTAWSKTTRGGYVSNVYVAGPGLAALRVTMRRC